MTTEKRPVKPPMQRRECLACCRPIEHVWDVPRVSVDTVKLLGLQQRHLPVGMKGRENPRQSRRLQRDVRQYWDDHERMLATAREVAELDVVRAYTAHLRKLTGRSVPWSALLPPWAARRTGGDHMRSAVPGSPGEGRWVVGLFTKWLRGLHARVNVKLVFQARDFGEFGGTLARVRLRGNLLEEDRRGANKRGSHQALGPTKVAAMGRNVE